MMSDTLFKDQELTTPNLVVGGLFVVFASLPLLSFLVGVFPSVTSWIGSAALLGVGIGFLIASFFQLTITGTEIRIREGLRLTKYPYSIIEETLAINTPNFPSGRSGGKVMLSLQKPTGQIDTSAAWETSMPWSGAPRSILLLCRGSRNNYVLPHPKADDIVKMIDVKIKERTRTA